MTSPAAFLFRRTPPQGLRITVALLMLMLLSIFCVQAQGGPSPQVRNAIAAAEAMLGGSDDASLSAFASQRLAPTYRSQFSDAGLIDHLKRLREAARDALGDISVEAEEDGLHLILSDKRRAEYLLSIDDAGMLTEFALVDAGAASTALPPSITWASFPAVLREAEAKGFSGVVSATHGGKQVLRQAYGLADRDAGRRTRIDTVYGIGSTPIDFTVTAALLLAQRGKLSLDDRIGQYIKDVPADRSAMTLRHLMSGRSGLPDFPATDTDWDADLAWIDRDTLIARAMTQPLLFAPGSGDAHSHTAYGLLAAIVELASGESYRDFIRREILDVAGMHRTGFYGETLRLAPDDFAVGYGASAAGLPNIPPNWGPTSWLVMGSGGMYSTLDDMRRYYDAIASGRILHDPWRQQQSGATVGVGGSDRGYFYFHAFDGGNNRIQLLMNGEGRDPEIRALTRALEQLVEPRPSPDRGAPGSTDAGTR